MQLSIAKLKQTIGFYPNPVQQEILKNMNRFTVVVGGRRLGKTILASYLALREMFKPNKQIWIVAPTHDLSSRVWEYLDPWIHNNFPEMFRVNKHEHIIENIYTGSKLWTKTTESPESLRGKGLDLAILDEAAIIPTGIFDGHIKPNLMDKQGKAFFISNPFGFNWFYDLYLRGTTEGRVDNPEYMSFSFPTAIENEVGEVIGSNNSIISINELRANKKTTPVDIWKQEYLAVFQEGAGQRFKAFEKCIDDDVVLDDPFEWFEDPIPNHLYFVGVDIARVEDFTVVTVIDRVNHRMVGFYRVNSLSWDFMRKKVLDISTKYYDAEITIDATGTGGDIFAEDLLAIGANVDTKFIYTNAKKNMLIDKLAVLMERGKLTFPRIPQLINEIRSFTYHFTNSGNMVYGSSRKDDCLNSLALACWKLNDEPLGAMDNPSIWIPRHRSFT
ncbi:MAG: terminase family protein [Nanoarchaeota archaeon]